MGEGSLNVSSGFRGEAWGSPGGVLVEAQPSCDGHWEAHPICRHCHLGLKVDSGVLECN